MYEAQLGEASRDFLSSKKTIDQFGFGLSSDYNHSINERYQASQF